MPPNADSLAPRIDDGGWTANTLLAGRPSGMRLPITYSEGTADGQRSAKQVTYLHISGLRRTHVK